MADFRCYSSDGSKLTTHYTICPREKDERWKGDIINIYLLFSKSLKILLKLLKGFHTLIYQNY